MRKPMSLKARRELLKSVQARYVQAGRKEKERMLDELTSATGYHRKYLITALRKVEPVAKKPRRCQPRVYTAEVRRAIVQVWQASNHLCAKRLAPFLAEFVPILERLNHLKLTDEVRRKVVGISPATLDRVLAPVRRRRKAATTGKATYVKHQIPIRTFSEWDDRRPGFLEADLVVHCGTTVSGTCLHTLTLTDVASGWTECLALPARGQECVTRALERAVELFPFPILGLDTDNGSEFMNRELLAFCQTRGIHFTRSRPYRKNDQCFVEQKNGSIVRRLVGYDRFEGAAACRQLAELHGIIRLHVNFFQPSMKLTAKHRTGSRVKKTYDQAKTPFRRLLDFPDLPAETKQRLEDQSQKLDPVEILERLGKLQNLLWQYAVGREPDAPEPHLTRTSEKINLELEDAEPPVKTWRSAPKVGRSHFVKHTWRTRPDPFALVWEELVPQLEATPSLTAKELLHRLQAQYPGQFPDGQMRTLQRRVQAWRREKLAAIPILIESELGTDQKVEIQPAVNAPEQPLTPAMLSLACATPEAQGAAPAAR